MWSAIVFNLLIHRLLYIRLWLNASIWRAYQACRCVEQTCIFALCVINFLAEKPPALR